ncbi:MAG: DUF5916 domain-containing protein [Vicinamibacterales bacterium]
MARRAGAVCLLTALAASVPAPSLAQEVDPPVPVAPAVINRDAAGRATIRAVRVSAPIRIDGTLDEDVYRTTEAISGFIQVEPNVGAVETEKTELWVFFDDTNLYVSFRCWDSHPERQVANEMRRDSNQLVQNEHVSFVLDTFHDKRNMFAFNIGILGGRMDGQMTNETQFNMDFNPIWRVATGRSGEGWTGEAAVPFKSLRFKPGSPQVWGFNARRTVRWKNESSHIVPMPARGLNALAITSLAPNLVLDVPETSRLVEVKPYAVGGVATDLTALPPTRNDATADWGIDVKYGLTQNLTSDFTYNTDFAQVEADEQQVNLTRFSLFFPEKREFFLENSTTFAFGGTASGSGDTPLMFYSRRIGLAGAREVPLVGGGRLTGRVGSFDVGAVSIRADAEPLSGSPATTFSVARLRRDLLRQSSIGFLATHRTTAGVGLPRTAFGFDGVFKFFKNLYANTYWANTPRPDGADGTTSYRAQVDYPADRYGFQAEHLLVGRRFAPEVGFVRRPDMRKSYVYGRFSPRTAKHPWIRRYVLEGSSSRIANHTGRVESTATMAAFAMELHNSDRISASVTNSGEFLPLPFRIGPGVTLPVGQYDFLGARAAYSFGAQRKISGNVSLERGAFYNGHRTVFGVSGSRVEVTPRLSLQPTASVNDVQLAQGSFRATLVGSRITYTVTPLMFVSALVQYNSSNNSFSTNTRLRWEYLPGSELFVVFNEQRDTLGTGAPDLVGRSLVFKLNRLLRF